MKTHFLILPFLLFLVASLFPSSHVYAVEEAGSLIAQGKVKVDNGDYAEAEELFQKALKLDDSMPGIYFGLGRLSYIKDDCGSADEYLTKFKSLSDDDDLKHYADGLMDTCREDSKTRFYTLDIALGAQLDSNVIVEPANPSTKADKKKDTRLIMFLKGSASLFDYQNVSLAADYSLYQSQHASLNDVNLQSHLFKPVLNFNVSDTIMPSLGYSLEFVKVDKDKYSNIHKFFAELLIIHSDRMSTEMSIEYRRNKYWNSVLYPSNSERNGDGYLGNIRQNINSGRVATGLFLKSAFVTADMDYWSYDMLGGGADVNFRIDSDLNLGASAEYEERNYDGLSPSATNARIDKMQKYLIELTYMMTDRVAISIADEQTINDSGLEDYKYNRNIASFFISVGIL